MAITEAEQAQAVARAQEALRHVVREIEAEFGVAAIREELLHLPEEIRRQQEAVKAARQAVEEMRVQVEAAEANLMLDIANAIDTKTGKAMYSNDGARKAELARRKATDEEYVAAAKALQEAESSLATVQFELDLLVNRFSAIRHLSDMTGARMRLLAG